MERKESCQEPDALWCCGSTYELVHGTHQATVEVAWVSRWSCRRRAVLTNKYKFINFKLVLDQNVNGSSPTTIRLALLGP